MSGTSCDGIDGVALEISAQTSVGDRPQIRGVGIRPQMAAGKTKSRAKVTQRIRVLAHARRAYPPKLRAEIETVIAQSKPTLDQLGTLDAELGMRYAQVAQTLLRKIRGHGGAHDSAAGDGEHSNSDSVTVIGCHGQTIRHHPGGKFPFSLQLGNGAVLARRTGLPVVTDFRAADIAAGGQGAPLAPAFHRAVFADARAHRAVLNLGGIANLTFLPAHDDARVRGFDTGPGNTLLDHFCRAHFHAPFDAGGNLARGGKVHPEFLAALLADPYFARPPPKSTGREYFHAEWLARMRNPRRFAKIPRRDILATLTALTAESVTAAVRKLRPRPRELFVCGGGARNRTLLGMLAARFDGEVQTTRALGVDPQHVEAAAFAWMAWRTLHARASTLPQVTGAKNACIAGVIHRA